MRERDIDRKMFHRGHWEVIAAQFRGQLDRYLPHQVGSLQSDLHRSASVVDLAIEMAKRFQLDNSDFDPLVFLDRCSPNSELYPLSELWEGVDQTEVVDD